MVKDLEGARKTGKKGIWGKSVQIDITKLIKDMKICPVPDYQNVTSTENFNNQIDRMSCSLDSNQFFSWSFLGS